MLKKYLSLLQLNLQHSYFGNTSGSFLQITPTGTSKKTMQQLDIVVKQEPAGCKLYFGQQTVDGIENARLAALDTPIVLTFMLELNDPLFLNYTQLDLPENSNQKFIYKITHSAEKTDAEKTIKASSALFAKIGGMRQRVAFNPPAEGASMKVTLQNADGHICLEETIDADNAKFGTCDLFIPQKEGSGVFELNFLPSDASGDTAVEKHSIYASDDQISQHVFGLFQIVITPPQGGAELSANSSTYKLSFDARKTIWRYYVINQSNLAFDRIRLLQDDVILSEQPATAKQTIANGMEAYVLTSNEPLALQKQPTAKTEIALIQTQGGDMSDNSVQKIRAPFPDANQITTEDEEGKRQLYSNVYLYL